MAPVAGRHYGQRELRRLRRPASSATPAAPATTSASCVDGADPATRARPGWAALYRPHDRLPVGRRARASAPAAARIAWVDRGGLLHVGPQSAGADPGPACYGRGGSVADRHRRRGRARLPRSRVLPRRRDAPRSRTPPRRAIGRDVAEPLGLTVEEAAAAIADPAPPRTWSRAIRGDHGQPGHRPARRWCWSPAAARPAQRRAIARELGCRSVLVPRTGAARSAPPAACSPTSSREFAAHVATSTPRDFDSRRRQRRARPRSSPRAERFSTASARLPWRPRSTRRSEARYPQPGVGARVPLPARRLRDGEADVTALRATLSTRIHERVFAVDEPGAARSSAVTLARAGVASVREHRAAAPRRPCGAARRRCATPSAGVRHRRRRRWTPVYDGAGSRRDRARRTGA